MSKQRPEPRPVRETPASGQTAANADGWLSPAAIRETVESIIVAFVLAFLFRTFEAEAFVIPTGSMAPTLMGRHKDVNCPKCGCEYQVSASERPDSSHQSLEVYSGTCPMCRWTANLGPDNPQHETYTAFSGDRILVGKFPYEFSEPKRWDVIVFKFPGEATINYIKRLVGLPGETIRIHYGDLWRMRPDGSAEILRKPPNKLQAMLQPVFDNDLAPKITALGWPARWRPWTDGEGNNRWTAQGDGSFQTATGAGEAWLRYQHLAPNFQQWQERERLGTVPPDDQVRPQLISDFTAYNTGYEASDQERPVTVRPPNQIGLGVHWVGDLALTCTIEAQSKAGAVIFELVKGGGPANSEQVAKDGRRFQCRLDLTTGEARLSISGVQGFHPTAKTVFRGGAKHRIMFSNIDDELRLSIDGDPVTFDGPTSYDGTALGTHVPTEADLSPVGIAASGASVKVSHLKLSRDIYYIADTRRNRMLCDYLSLLAPDLADETTWPRTFADDNMNQVEFRLAAPDRAHPGGDQFFVLGDNSAQSKDGRLWSGDQIESYVRRDLLIGKALLIYWPHSWDQLPYVHVPFTSKHVPFPYFPNFSRMQLVR